MSVKVSIILPTYKRVDYLRESLGSVMIQTYENWECIVINDDPNSRGVVDVVIREFNDDRIQVIHNEVNLRIAGARNAGIKVATGEIIALLDDDDWWKANHLTLMVDAFKDPEVVFAYSGYVRHVEGVIEKEDMGVQAITPPKDVFKELMSGNFTINLASILSFRTSCLRKIGDLDTELNGFEDWDICVRASREGKVVSVPGTSAFQRVHYGDRLSTSFDSRMRVLDLLRTKWGKSPGFYRFYSRYEMEAYHAAMINEVMAKTKGRRLPLLKQCLLACDFSNLMSVKVYIKSVLIAMGGIRVVKHFV